QKGSGQQEDIFPAPAAARSVLCRGRRRQPGRHLGQARVRIAARQSAPRQGRVRRVFVVGGHGVERRSVQGVVAMWRRGFTLIELLVVMAIIATLLSLALPRYFGSIDKSKEVTLQQSLTTMRDAIDKFYADNGRYPEQVGDLVEKRYL